MEPCCSNCPRTSTSSGMTRHRQTCKLYKQFMAKCRRLAQSAEQTKSIARRTVLQATQQVVSVDTVEGADRRHYDSVSFTIVISTQFVLTCRSPLPLIKQKSTCLMYQKSHC